MLPDSRFLELARELGTPPPGIVEAMLLQQQAHAAQGRPVTLLELARSAGALSAEDLARFEAAAEPPQGAVTASGRRSRPPSSRRPRQPQAPAPPRGSAPPAPLLVGIAVGVAALGVLALTLVGRKAPPPPPPPAVAATTEAPKVEPYAAVAQREAVKARELVEAGRGPEAQARLERLIERWKREPAPPDALEELLRLRDWVVDSVRDAERARQESERPPAEPEPRPAPRPAPATEAPPPPPRPEEPPDEEPPREPPPRAPTARPGGPGPVAPPDRERDAPGASDGARPTPPAPQPPARPGRGAPAGGAAAPGAADAGVGRAATLDPAYQAKRAAVPAGDADAFLRLARWAEKEDLFEEEKDALLLALRADPAHEKGRARLDEVLAEEARHRDMVTPWRRDASVLFVETNTTQAWLHYYCDSVAAFYKRFSRVFRVKQDPLQAWGRKIGVKIFASREDFDRYRKASSGAGESAVGYYSLRAKELVLYHDGSDVEETLNTLFHEGTHLFTHLALGDRMYGLPMWVGEGIAEYFGTARFDRESKDVEFGALHYGRLLEARAVLDRQHVSLRADLVAHDDRRSFTSSRYALAWTLVHMLVEKTRPGSDKPIYRERFVAYFDAVAGGADSLTAFEAHIGPVRAIEEEWKAYVASLPLPPFHEAMARLDAGELEEAIRLFQAHRAAEPKDARGAYWLGEALAEAQRLEEAVEAYRAAVALDPQHADAHVSLAYALMVLDRAAEAVEAAKQAVAARPSGEHHMLLALTAVQAGDKPVAQAAVREAIKLLGPLPSLRRLQMLADSL